MNIIKYFELNNNENTFQNSGDVVQLIRLSTHTKVMEKLLIVTLKKVMEMIIQIKFKSALFL